MPDTPTNLVDLVEALGAKVAHGGIARVVAVQHIVEFSEGRITRLGAADMLNNYDTVRAAYQEAADVARTALHELRGDPS